MLIDELKVHMKAGDGGDGVVRWKHEKGKEFGGPSGGDGGKGGAVYIEGVRDLNKLYDYKNIKEFVAENGEDGKKDSKHGKNGENLFVKLPIGSVVKNIQTDEIFEIIKDGQKEQILKGGNGGYGNEYFKSSVNVSPREFTNGASGEEADFFIELKLIADAGLIGLPNAGKTSILNALTNASAKVADYPFTTLDPNLGSLYGFILADIPGLIEGASKGKGLGYKFLRHVERTKILIHCVSLENEDVLKTYEVVRSELSGYGDDMGCKDEIILLTKSDLVGDKTRKNAESAIKKTKKTFFSVSILDEQSIKKFRDSLIKIFNSQPS